MTIATKCDLRQSGSMLFEMLPTIALAVLGALFAFEATTPLVAVGTTNILTTVEILIVLTMAVWSVSLLSARRRPIVPSLVIAPALAWCAVLLASTVSAPGFIPQALRFTARMFTGMLIGWMCFDTVVTSHHPTSIPKSLAIGGTLVAGFGLAEALNMPGIGSLLALFKFAPTRIGDMLRISATLSYATITAMVLEMTFPLLLAWFVSTRSTVQRFVLGFAGIICLTVLVLTLSRAGIIALGAALAVVVLVSRWNNNRLVMRASIASGAALALLAVLGLLYDPEAGLRFTSENDRSWYRVSVDAPETLSANPGERILVPVRVTNTGEKAWSLDTDHPYALGYHLKDADQATVTYDGARTPFDSEVVPGQTIEMDAIVLAPTAPGDYVIEWDIVQNEVTWFSWKNPEIIATDFSVSGPPKQAAEIRYVPPPKENNTLPAPGRFQLWAAALSMFRAYPILGVGPDNFRLQYGPFSGAEKWNIDIHANNLYLEMLAGTGVIGVLTFIWLAWRIVALASRSLSEHVTGSSWVWRTALLASLTAWFVHGFFDYFYEFTPTYVAFWMVAGLAVGLEARESEDHRKTGVDADRI